MVAQTTEVQPRVTSCKGESLITIARFTGYTTHLHLEFLMFNACFFSDAATLEIRGRPIAYFHRHSRDIITVACSRRSITNICIFVTAG